MRNVVAAAVPRLGDWCSIFVLPTNGSPIPDIEVAHADPAMVAYARELMERFPFDPDAPVGAPQRHPHRQGRADHRRRRASTSTTADMGYEAREVLERLQLRSLITVPLIKRGRVLGALQLVMSRSGRKYGPDDLALAEAVGVRIASSLQNQRLSDEQRHIARDAPGEPAAAGAAQGRRTSTSPSATGPRAKASTSAATSTTSSRSVTACGPSCSATCAGPVRRPRRPPGCSATRTRHRRGTATDPSRCCTR